MKLSQRASMAISVLLNKPQPRPKIYMNRQNTLSKNFWVQNAHQKRVEGYAQGSTWEYPGVSFAEQISELNSDTDMLDSLGFLVDSSVGRGFYVTASDQRIVDAITDHMNEILADEVTLYHAEERLAFGNTFWMPDEGNNILQWVKLGTISHCKIMGKPLYFGRTDGSRIDADLVLHAAWKRRNAETFGRGLILPLIEEQPYRVYDNNGNPVVLTKPATTNMKKQFQHDAHIRHHKTTGQNVFMFEGIDEDEQTELKEALNSPYAGRDPVLNYKGEVIEMGKGRTVADDSVKKIIDEEFIKATGNPEVKLITADGYTEASALAAVKAASIRLNSFERAESTFWTTQIIRPWYETNYGITDANGVPILWKDAKVEIKWGSEELGEVDFASFVNLVALAQTDEYRTFSQKELRRNARKFDLELDADETLGLDNGTTQITIQHPPMQQQIKESGEVIDLIAKQLDKLQSIRNAPKFTKVI